MEIAVYIVGMLLAFNLIGLVGWLLLAWAMRREGRGEYRFESRKKLIRRPDGTCLESYEPWCIKTTEFKVK